MSPRGSEYVADASFISPGFIRVSKKRISPLDIGDFSIYIYRLMRMEEESGLNIFFLSIFLYILSLHTLSKNLLSS